jgi:CheY-like chemotaxis protein
MMTAYGDQATKEALVKKGASLVLAKPFDDILKIPELV